MRPNSSPYGLRRWSRALVSRSPCRLGWTPPAPGQLHRPLPRASAAVRKDNASLRPSILPNLLEAVRYNERNGTYGARLFEIASTFWNDPQGNVVERRRVGLVGSSDVREVRGTVEAVLG